MEDLELTILMPCLNEAETLADCMTKAKAFLKAENIAGEILIADNGSTDGSQQIAQINGARVISVQERGYGAAILAGIQAAQGRYIIMGDADGSYDFYHLMPFVMKLRAGNDLVMGNRFLGGIAEGAMPFLNKYLGNPVLSMLGRLFFKSAIGDFHCGLRGFNRAAIQQLNLQAKGMEFASEIVVKATLNRLKIVEVPTTLSPDGRSRKPHLRPWRDGWRHLRLLLLFSPRWLFMYPGMLLVMLGSLFMLLLMNGMLKIGKYYLDIHTMLFASLCIIVGLQAVFFSLFSRLTAANMRLNTSSLGQVRFFKFFTLERGLLLGLLLACIGCGGTVYAFLFWMGQSFGPLIPTTMMRVLIPSFTFLISGVQIIFASFFASMLGLSVGQR